MNKHAQTKNILRARAIHIMLSEVELEALTKLQKLLGDRNISDTFRLLMVEALLVRGFKTLAMKILTQ